MILKRCPKCRQLILIGEISVDPGCGVMWWDGGCSRASPTEARLLSRLLVAPTLTTTRDLVDWLYGDEPAGGPLAADKIVGVHLFRLRAALKRSGCPRFIKSNYSFGYEIISIAEAA